MYCEKCGQNPASVHFVQIINGIKTDKHLCPACAGAVQGLTFEPQLFSNFFAEPSSARACPECGTTFSDFSKTGLFGCPTCYSFFANELLEPLRNLHGATSHAGSAPVGENSDIARLRKRLQEAVASEDYESAACLRDEIRKNQEGTS